MARSPGLSALVRSQSTASLRPTRSPGVGEPPGSWSGQRPGLGWCWALALVGPGLGAAVVLAPPGPALAGSVVCASSLVAPLPVKGAAPGTPSALTPVLVTRCGPVVTTPQLVERRAYTWTAPFAQGVDLVHQFTDVLGIAVAGRDGSTVMGLGFPDQTLIWDATAIGATNRVLLDAQSNSMPFRTADVSNGFCSALAQGGCGLPGAGEPDAPAAPRAMGLGTAQAPVRGLW